MYKYINTQVKVYVLQGDAIAGGIITAGVDLLINACVHVYKYVNTQVNMYVLQGDAGRGGIITAAKELLAEAANAARFADASTRRTSQ